MAPKLRIVKCRPEIGKRKKSKEVSPEVWGQLFSDIARWYREGISKKKIHKRLSNDGYHLTLPQLSVKMRSWGFARTNSCNLISHAMYENINVSLYTESGTIELHQCELERTIQLIESTNTEACSWLMLTTACIDILSILPSQAYHCPSHSLHIICSLTISVWFFLSASKASLIARGDSIKGHSIFDASLEADTLLNQLLFVLGQLGELPRFADTFAKVLIDFEDCILWYRLNPLYSVSDLASRKYWLLRAPSYYLIVDVVKMVRKGVDEALLELRGDVENILILQQ